MKALAATTAEAHRLAGLGLAYLMIVAALVWVSIAAYRHEFADEIAVRVQAQAAAQQLNVGGDVRMNGAIVGRVSRVSRSAKGGAEIELQIDRTSARRIPSDVVARILPTTLFGQKYVELRSSTPAAQRPLQDDAVIEEDRSSEAVELSDVLDDIYPVLNAVQPDRLAATLGALSTSLDGRGEEMHHGMEETATYLRELNSRTALLERDLTLFDRVSGQYATNAPTFLSLLGRSTTVSESLTSKQDAIAQFVESVTGAATSGEQLLRANRENLVETARLARPTLELLAEYSPEYVCVVKGFLAVERGSAAQIRGNRFQGHFTMGAQADGYTLADRLQLGDLGVGPHCRGNPDAPVPYPAVDLDDGVTP